MFVFFKPKTTGPILKSIFHVLQFQIECLSRNQNFHQGNPQRDQQGQHTSNKHIIGSRLRIDKDQVHTNHTQKKTQHSGELHVFDHTEAPFEIVNLLNDDVFFRLFEVFFMKPSDQIGNGQKSICKSQHHQGDGRKK